MNRETKGQTPGTDGRTYIQVPAPHSMLVEANVYSHKVYGNHTLTLNESERWWLKNPYFLAVLCSEESKKLLGYFSVLPLKELGVRRLEEGGEEQEINSKFIFPPERMRKADCLYLANVVSVDYGSELGKARTSRLFSGFVAYYKKYYGEDTRRLLALAATENGTRLLNRVSAQVVHSGQDRKDGRDLCEVLLTTRLLNEIEEIARKRASPAITRFKSVP